jgi:hypothetical protein
MNGDQPLGCKRHQDRVLEASRPGAVNVWVDLEVKEEPVQPLCVES